MKTILFLHNNIAFKSRIKYVLDFINNHPFAFNKLRFISKQDEGRNDLIINYGTLENKFDFTIPAQKFIFNSKLPKFDQIIVNSYSYNDASLYSVEQKTKLNNIFLDKNIYQFDIIESIFFHISRFEEWFYLDGRKDEHGRMDSSHQILVKNNIYKKPIIDDLIYYFIKSLGIIITKSATKIRITHDIDFILRKNSFWNTFRSIGGAILKRRNIQSALLIWKSRKVKNVFDTFDWMLRKEENFEKIIYFLMGGKSKYDNQYDLNLPIVQKAFQLSESRNYKIGIHPSYETWKDLNLFFKERDKLEKFLRKQTNYTRQHFLRFSFPETPKIIQKLKIKEDSSLGFADRIGFRCGTGFPYRLYDFEKEEAFDFLETPLILMDSALFKEGENNPERIATILKDFLLHNKYNTKITFNFHNSRFYDAHINNIPLRELYESLFQ